MIVGVVVIVFYLSFVLSPVAGVVGGLWGTRVGRDQRSRTTRLLKPLAMTLEKDNGVPKNRFKSLNAVPRTARERGRHCSFARYSLIAGRPGT